MSHLSRETKALLERGREGEPLSDAHRRRLKRAVLMKAGVASLLAAASPAAAWTSSALKVAAVVSAIAVTGTVAVVGIQAARAPAARGTVAPVTRPAPSAPQPVSAPVSAFPPVAAAPVAPSAAIPPGAPLPVEARAAAPAPVEGHAGAVPVMPQARAKPAAEPAAPPAPPQPDGQTQALAPASSLSSEARLLRDAHEALASGDAEGALRLLDEHAARFPASVLEPERSAERVFALCRAGRLPEARAATADFAARHPSGPLSGRVRASCGAPDR